MAQAETKMPLIEEPGRVFECEDKWTPETNYLKEDN